MLERLIAMSSFFENKQKFDIPVIEGSLPFGGSFVLWITEVGFFFDTYDQENQIITHQKCLNYKHGKQLVQIFI